MSDGASLARRAYRRLRRLIGWGADARPRNPIRIDGLTFYHHGRRESPNVLRMQTGDFERDLTALLLRLVRPGSHFVDAGAYIGYYSVLVGRRLAGSGRVSAFEPSPATRVLLERNLRANGLSDVVTVRPEALSDGDGTATFTPHGNATRSSLYARPGMEHNRAFTVATLRLDTLLSREGWPAVDVIKIDVEGAEVDVLRGMPECCRRNPDLKVLLEYNPVTLAVAAHAPDGLMRALTDLGLTRCYVVERGLEPIGEPGQDWSEFDAWVRRQPGNVNMLCVAQPFRLP